MKKIKKNNLTKRKFLYKTKKNKNNKNNKNKNTRKYKKKEFLGGTQNSEKIENEIRELTRRIEALRLQQKSLEELQNKILKDSQSPKEEDQNMSIEQFEDIDLSDDAKSPEKMEISENNSQESQDMTQDIQPMFEENLSDGIENTEIKRTNAISKITQFIKSSKKFLQLVCSNSGQCFAFGNYIKELNNFFKGFVKFEYAINPIKTIGAVSSNGFVKRIEYMRDNYKAYTVLKSSQNQDTDNLLYEYIVGIKFINRVMVSFPCFLQTYGLYYYDSDSSWQTMHNNEVDVSYLKHLNLQNNLDYKKACKESKYIAILIQDIESAKSMDFMIKKVAGFGSNNLVHVLFILYQALSSLSKVFTHYDLHLNNVLIYDTSNTSTDCHIKYIYHESDGSTFEFNCKYIPKIIDYGRCYFDNGNINSLKIYNYICKIQECNPDCGSDYGFIWLDPKSSYYIISSKKNESHDLRLINEIKPYIKIQNKNSIINKIKYGIGLPKQYSRYGTEENLNMDTTSEITNVNSFHNVLKEIIKDPATILKNQNDYNGSKMLYELHIYYDQRPMKIVQNK